MTTLGWLKHIEAPVWQYFEHQYRRFLHNTLTYDWQCISGGVGLDASHNWMNMCKVLELDRKTRVDFFLSAQSGLVGRTIAN